MNPQPGDVLRTEEHVKPHNNWLFELTEHGELRFMKDIKGECIYYPHYVGSNNINYIAYASSEIARVRFMNGKIDLSKETLKYILFMEEQSLNDMKRRLSTQIYHKNNFELRTSLIFPDGTREGYIRYFETQKDLTMMKKNIDIMRTQVELFEKEFNEFQTKVYNEVK